MINSYVKNEYCKEGSDFLGTPAQSIMKAVWYQEVVEFLSLKSSVEQSVCRSWQVYNLS
jgi:hypothetical protein